MLVKEWTTDDKGRICATWVKRESVSPVRFDLPGEITTNAPNSNALPTDLTENATRVSAVIKEQPTVQRSSGHSTPSRPPKGGIWTSFHTVLRSVLP
jgi:hypothetical protein